MFSSENEIDRVSMDVLKEEGYDKLQVTNGEDKYNMYRNELNTINKPSAKANDI